MSLYVPTAQELTDQNVARFESALGQTVPLNDNAFIRVVSAVEALADVGLYRFAIERIKQNLALTATGDGLARLGEEYQTVKKLAISTVLTIELPGLNGTIIPATAAFIGTPNGIQYFVDNAVEIIGGVAVLTVTAESTGVIGNLQIGDELSIVSAVAGAEYVATVTEVVTTGADLETDIAYRPRVQFAMRAATGGSNATDHKIWAEQVAGVLRAFPFGGKPIGGGTSYPGDRVVYVEADPSVNPDGIPPQSMLDDVRASINIDPDTGESRFTLGLTDETLYVEPITRSEIDVEIVNLVAPVGTDATVKAAILDALNLYFAGLFTYVEGVDLVQDRNDQITKLSLGQVIQDVLSSTGSSAEDVSFEVATVAYDLYQLSQGELAKTGSVTYVTV